MHGSASIPVEPAPSAVPTLKQRAMRATIISVAGFFAHRGMRLVSNLILTRILAPEAFGVMLLVTTITQGLQMFSDIGVGPAIIQNKRGDDPIFYNTAWTMQVVRGVVLWLASCAIAWPMAAFYTDTPDLLLLVPATALTAIITGFNSTGIFALNRHLQLGREMTLELTAKVLSLIVTVVAAVITRSVWGLVIGTIASALVTAVLSHTLIPEHRNRFAWDRDAARELFRFGRWIFVATLLTFLAMSVDRLILGKLIPASMLGVFAIAFLLYDVPRTLVMRMARKVIYPMMSRRANLEREEFRERVGKSRLRLLLVSGAALAVLVGFADWAIYLLYEDPYWQAGWMLCLLAAGLWFRVLDQTVSMSLMVYNRLQYNPLGSVLRFGLIGIGLPLAVKHFGLFAGMIVIAAGDVPNYVASQIGLIRNRLSLFRQDIVATGVFAALLAAMIGGRVALGWGHPLDNMAPDSVWRAETALDADPDSPALRH